MFLHYNIAAEYVLFPIMKVTFLKSICNWYYFVSFENYSKEKQHYPNLIWLFKKWDKKSKRIANRFSFMTARVAGR